MVGTQALLATADRRILRGGIGDASVPGFVTAQTVRADRLLAEFRVSGDGPIQLTRLFGISDPTAIQAP
jgi:hypothetical protein